MAQDSKSLTNRLAECLAECADDLECEIKASYGGSINGYPAQMRRYLRDMLLVEKARELIAEEKNAQL